MHNQIADGFGVEAFSCCRVRCQEAAPVCQAKGAKSPAIDYDHAVSTLSVQVIMTASATEPHLPAALLSDMDGLLLDTERLSFVTFNIIAARYGFSDDGSIFNQLIGLNREGHQRVFSQLLPAGIDPDAFDAAWKDEFMAMLEEDVPLKPGARQVLAWLAERNVPIALVTSTRTAKAEMLMQRTGLDAFLDIIIGGDQVTAGKPAPDIYLKAATHLGKAAPDCLAFEDSANGVRAAHAAGARVIQVVDLLPPDDALSALGHEVTSSLAEAAQLLNWHGIPDLEA